VIIGSGAVEGSLFSTGEKGNPGSMAGLPVGVRAMGGRGGFISKDEGKRMKDEIGRYQKQKAKRLHLPLITCHL
jgi:hypothetical protein